jgi:hypothetical protein
MSIRLGIETKALASKDNLIFVIMSAKLAVYRTGLPVGRFILL